MTLARKCASALPLLAVAALMLGGCISAEYAQSTGSEQDFREQTAGRAHNDTPTRNRARAAELELIEAVMQRHCFAAETPKADAATRLETVVAPTHHAEYGTNGGGGGC